MMGEGMQIFKTSDINYIARRTYLASVRFIRMAEIPLIIQKFNKLIVIVFYVMDFIPLILKK